MRKKTLNCLFDNTMWYLIYLLPLIAFGIILIHDQSISLSGAMSSIGLGILTSNPIYVALDGIFGATGVMPLFVSADILLYFSYFICCWLCHIAVDVLLFLVRWAHHMMDAFGGDKS